MNRILVFGAGRSAFYTIEYLLQQSAVKGWTVTIADSSEANIKAAVADFPVAHTRVLDVNSEPERKALIAEQDIVISLLPARFHNLVAQDCLEAGKHLITPSYLSTELQAMHKDVEAKGLIFLNELGLDPGIDHMSAMEIIHRLKEEGADITSFRSWCGGLIAHEDDTNPWHYKFSWNPYNVIRAGQDGAMYRLQGKIRYIPYHRLFSEIEIVEVEGESFEGYFNRNSLPYIEYYGLDQTTDFLRGTLRYPDFCRKWNLLVQAGMTSDKVPLPGGAAGMRFDELTSIFVSGGDMSAEDIRTINSLNPSNETWDFSKLTPAESLQKVLEKEWAMKPDDKDRVVMIHEFRYTKAGEQYELKSWMDQEGENSHRTAMARTVGMPLALAAELIAEKKITHTGALLPIIPEVYRPLLERLKDFGISFRESVNEVSLAR